MAESREPKIQEFWLLKLRDSKLEQIRDSIYLPASHATGTDVPTSGVTGLLVCIQGASCVVEVSLMGRAVVGSTWRKSRCRKQLEAPSLVIGTQI